MSRLATHNCTLLSHNPQCVCRNAVVVTTLFGPMGRRSEHSQRGADHVRADFCVFATCFSHISFCN
eukprot:11219455-Lingulodinium_polyedra.AAC.1